MLKIKQIFASIVLISGARCDPQKSNHYQVRIFPKTADLAIFGLSTALNMRPSPIYLSITISGTTILNTDNLLDPLFISTYAFFTFIYSILIRGAFGLDDTPWHFKGIIGTIWICLWLWHIALLGKNEIEICDEIWEKNRTLLEDGKTEETLLMEISELQAKLPDNACFWYGLAMQLAFWASYPVSVFICRICLVIESIRQICEVHKDKDRLFWLKSLVCLLHSILLFLSIPWNSPSMEYISIVLGATILYKLWKFIELIALKIGYNSSSSHQE